jgi:hypothetical protein
MTVLESIVPRITSLEVTDEFITAWLTDGRVIDVPLV